LIRTSFSRIEIADILFFSVPFLFILCGCRSFSSVRDAEVEPSVSKGLSSTLARAADTLRVALLGEKVDESAANTGGRNFSTDNFELLPSSDDQEAAAASNDNRERETLAENRKKFPAYQSASFRSWRMNISSPLRLHSVIDNWM
jgi:hypothetical protein